MAQPKASIPSRGGQNVGAQRGGSRHLVDGIGPGKGVISKKELAGKVLPQRSTTNPTGSEKRLT
tara:strand:+ start:593 stop:784 length:192 start_codon:yes stop_codon:yes gene_type:complete